jgi:hypothetical protein
MSQLLNHGSKRGRTLSRVTVRPQPYTTMGELAPSIVITTPVR